MFRTKRRNLTATRCDRSFDGVRADRRLEADTASPKQKVINPSIPRDSEFDEQLWHATVGIASTSLRTESRKMAPHHLRALPSKQMGVCCASARVPPAGQQGLLTTQCSRRPQPESCMGLRHVQPGRPSVRLQALGRRSRRSKAEMSLEEEEERAEYERAPLDLTLRAQPGTRSPLHDSVAYFACERVKGTVVVACQACDALSRIAFTGGASHTRREEQDHTVRSAQASAGTRGGHHCTSGARFRGRSSGYHDTVWIQGASNRAPRLVVVCGILLQGDNVGDRCHAPATTMPY